jgi:hypothetical protein
LPIYFGTYFRRLQSATPATQPPFSRDLMKTSTFDIWNSFVIRISSLVIFLPAVLADTIALHSLTTGGKRVGRVPQ